MSKGVVIHLDNDRKLYLDPCKNLFDQSGIDLDYLTCETKEEFQSLIDEHGSNLKALVFDLLRSDPGKEGLSGKNPEFLEYVRSSFANYNIPIFVYSGYLSALGDIFDKNGTVYKVDKGDGFDVIPEKIKFLYESGFVDVFCSGGNLEMEIKEELHNSFVNQFTTNEQIEELVRSISDSVQKPEEPSERVKKVFKRIAIKTLAADLLAPVADSEDKVHPIEHFYKRQSKLDIWTGDIWKEKENDNHVLVLTPRCDFATNKAEVIIVININVLPKPISLKGNAQEVEKRLRDYLTDNRPGKSTRYIPSNAFFPRGGMAFMNEHFTISKAEFIDNFEYVVTLSDDLTNEIIGKFAYYFLRTGITNIHEAEFESIIQAINSKDG